MRLAVVLAAAALSCRSAAPVQPIEPRKDEAAPASSSSNAGAATVMERRMLVRAGVAAPEHMLAMRAAYPALARCQPPANTTLTFVIAIDEKGKVSSFERVAGPNAPAFEACIFDTIKSIAFAPGPVTLEYTLGF